MHFVNSTSEIHIGEQLPATVLDSVLENPFIFDLLKSETVDWEINDSMYTANQNLNTNPIIGFLAGYLSELVRIFNSKTLQS